MPHKSISLNKFRKFGLILICSALTPYTNGVASHPQVATSIDCACCSPTVACGKNNKCNSSSPSPKDSCPCPPRCNANPGAGTLSICLETKAMQTKIPRFVLSYIAPTDTKYESRSYKPPTPPPKT
jgi:hypothetical protein